MQIVSIRDISHEVTKPVFGDKKEYYFKLSSAEIFTQHAMS